MNPVRDWLERELEVRVAWPDAGESMAARRAQLLCARRVAVFGAGGAGARLLAALGRRGVEVAYFLDSNRRGELRGVPVLGPGEAPADGLPLLIASTWFVEIARALDATGVLGGRLVVPVPDVLQVESELYDDAAGEPFAVVLGERLAEFRRVADLWDDPESRLRFLRLLNYRLGFFLPHRLDPEQLPCTAEEYARELPVPSLPAGLTEEAATLVRHDFARPAYSMSGFLEPKSGDVVVDGGAWEGDTAIWYSHHTGPHGHVYAFEPGAVSSRLQANLRAAGLQRRVTVVPMGLASRPGRAAWCELSDATPCSHLGAGSMDVSLTSIDSFVREQAIGRVDTIKLDVEGADLAALAGARSVICRDRPGLAVAVYHRAHHLVDIPLWIAEQGLGYRLRLSHTHLSISETVCLARAGQR